MLSQLVTFSALCAGQIEMSILEFRVLAKQAHLHSQNNDDFCNSSMYIHFHVISFVAKFFIFFFLWQDHSCVYFFKGSFCLLFSSRSSFPLLLLPLIVTSLVHLCCLSVFFFFLLSPLPNPPFFLPHCLSFLFLYVGFC